MRAPRCWKCGRLRVRPMFFLRIEDESYPICHQHVVDYIGEERATVRYGWEMQLSGAVWIVKVR